MEVDIPVSPSELNLPYPKDFDKDVWEIINSYFTTVHNYLSRIQTDGYNSFINDRIPKVIRQFNPISLPYVKREDNSFMFEATINIGGTKDPETGKFNNDGKGIYIGKPTIHEVSKGEEGDIIHNFKVLYPNEARLKNITYKTDVAVDIYITLTVSEDPSIPTKLVKELFFPKVPIGSIPVMLHSQLCVLEGNTGNTLLEMGECQFDEGGYFIIDGKEKVILGQEYDVENRVYVKAKKPNERYNYSTEVRSSPENKFQPARVSKVLCLNKREVPQETIEQNTLRVSIPRMNGELPLFFVFRALGYISDFDITNLILGDITGDLKERMLDYLEPTIKEGSSIFQQIDAFNFIVEHIDNKWTGVPMLSEKLKKVFGLELLRNHFLPHVGEDLKSKAHFLAYMTRETILTSLGLKQPTDRDSMGNKKVEVAGYLMASIFRDLYFRIVNRMKEVVNINYSHQDPVQNGKFWGEYDEIGGEKRYRFFKLFTTEEDTGLITINQVVERQIMDEGFNYAFKNCWGIPNAPCEEGIVQDLNRVSYLGYLSHLRRINTPLSASAKIRAPHQLHPSQWGIMCPSETPDGANCGIRKTLAMLTTVSFNINSSPLMRPLIASGLINLQENDLNRDKSATAIFLNERLVGYHSDPMYLYKKFKLLKRNALINVYTSISWNIIDNNIKIATDNGRCIRPVLTVDNGKLSLDQTQIDMIKDTDSGVNWYHLVGGFRNIGITNPFNEYDANYHHLNELDNMTKEEELEFLRETSGVIEYIDTAESNCSLIAIHPSELKDKLAKYTYCEIDASLMFGALLCNTVFANMNPATRDQFYTAQVKQALGIYATNYRNRMDTKGQIIEYPMKATVLNKMSKYVYSNIIPSGENAIVAIGCFSGYNQDDSILFNKSSVERGLFRSTKFTTYSDKEEIENGKKIEIIQPINLQTTMNIKSANYSKLDENGIIKPEVHVDDNDILVSKVMPLNDKDTEGRELYEDKSLIMKRHESGMVDRVYSNKGNDNQRYVKVRIRKEKIPELGDKFASRFGQKGTMGILIPAENMPVTKDGIVPDMIVNAHAFPTRMTIGQFMEVVLGKSVLELGIFAEIPHFRNLTPDLVGDVLQRIGWERYGNELMYNGQTGEMMNVNYFIGPTYYQRLYQQVADKYQSRDTGARTALTHQTVGGRAQGGGGRIGEMERDAVISHGLSSFLKESFMDRGDKYKFWISTKTGMISIVNPDRNIFQDFTSDATIQTVDNEGSMVKYPINNTNSEYLCIEAPYAFKLFLQEMEAMGINARLIGEKVLQEWKKLNKVSLATIGELEDNNSKIDGYYVAEGTRLTMPLRRFHNKIKDTLIISGIEKNASLIDFTTGRGGDLYKWLNGGYRTILGLDYSKSNIEEKDKIDGANSRLEKMKEDADPKVREWARNSNIEFIVADSSKNIRNLEAVKTHAPSYKPKLEDFLKNKPRGFFNRAVALFSIHYFFNQRNNIESLFENVRQNLRTGGYFVVTTLDGQKVFQALKKSRGTLLGKVYDESEGQHKVVWRIKADPKLNLSMEDLPEEIDRAFGNDILVEFESIGQELKESLVHPKVLINLASKYGLRLAPSSEVKSQFRYLKNASGPFSEIYKSYTLLNPDDSLVNELGGEDFQELKEYSDFHRYYVFKYTGEEMIPYKEYETEEQCLEQIGESKEEEVTTLYNFTPYTKSTRDLPQLTSEQIEELKGKVSEVVNLNTRKSPKKTAIILMGPPASGKSEYIESIVDKSGLLDSITKSKFKDFVYLNKDNIRELMPDYQANLNLYNSETYPYTASMSASDGNMVNQFRDFSDWVLEETVINERDIIMEIVGGYINDISRNITKMKSQGYQVVLLNLFTKSQEEILKEVDKRAKITGRYIPSKLIMEAQRNNQMNFKKVLAGETIEEKGARIKLDKPNFSFNLVRNKVNQSYGKGIIGKYPKKIVKKTLLDQHVNSKYPKYQQSILTAMDGDQVKNFISEERAYQGSSIIRGSIKETGRPAELVELYGKNLDRLGHKRFQSMNNDSFLRTMRLMFNIFKMGIFVKIKNNQLVMYRPFLNANYTSPFTIEKNGVKEVIFTVDEEKYPNGFADYFKEKKMFFNDEKELVETMDHPQWWVDGCILNTSTKFYDQIHYRILGIRHMLETLCIERRPGDAEFFININQNPLLYFEDGKLLSSGRSGSIELVDDEDILPVFSFGTVEGYSDIVLPMDTDWGLTLDKYIPTKCISNREKTKYLDSEKENKVIFMSTLDGCGDGKNPSETDKTELVKMIKNLKANRNDFIDFKIINVDERNRLGKDQKVDFIHSSTDIDRMANWEIRRKIGVDLDAKEISKRISIEEMSKYIGVLYVDGIIDDLLVKCMLSGSILIIVRSKSGVSAKETWARSVLKPIELIDLLEREPVDENCIIMDMDADYLAELETVLAVGGERNAILIENMAKDLENIYQKSVMLDYVETLVNKVSLQMAPNSVVEDINEMVIDDQVERTVINIPVEFMGIVIGKDGRNKRQLELNNNVSIDFTDKDQVVIEGKINQVLTVSGPQSGVRIVSDYLNKVAHTYSEVVGVDTDKMGILIGKGGENIEKIQETLDITIYTKISIEEIKNAIKGADLLKKKYIKIIGQKKNVLAGMKVVELLQNKISLVAALTVAEGKLKEIEVEPMRIERPKERTSRLVLDPSKIFHAVRPGDYNGEKYSIIIPYRDNPAQDRSEQLRKIIPYLERKLDGTNYSILVINQSDDGKKFNRGALLNIGAEIAKENGSEWVIFHDVDLLPDDALIEYYKTPPKEPIHIGSRITKYTYDLFLGAVLSISIKDNEKANGYPNCFYGWGGEDDAYLRRLYQSNTNLEIGRPRVGNYDELPHPWIESEAIPKAAKHEKLAKDENNWRNEGLNTITYDILSRSSLTNSGNAKRILVQIDSDECADIPPFTEEERGFERREDRDRIRDEEWERGRRYSDSEESRPKSPSDDWKPKSPSEEPPKSPSDDWRPASPAYEPASPAYEPASPAYDPAKSPLYMPASPAYEPESDRKVGIIVYYHRYQGGLTEDSDIDRIYQRYLRQLNDDFRQQLGGVKYQIYSVGNQPSISKEEAENYFNPTAIYKTEKNKCLLKGNIGACLNKGFLIALEDNCSEFVFLTNMTIPNKEIMEVICKDSMLSYGIINSQCYNDKQRQFYHGFKVSASMMFKVGGFNNTFLDSDWPLKDFGQRMLRLRTAGEMLFQNILVNYEGEGKLDYIWKTLSDKDREYFEDIYDITDPNNIGNNDLNFTEYYTSRPDLTQLNIAQLINRKEIGDVVELEFELNPETLMFSYAGKVVDYLEFLPTRFDIKKDFMLKNKSGKNVRLPIEVDETKEEFFSDNRFKTMTENLEEIENFARDTKKKFRDMEEIEDYALYTLKNIIDRLFNLEAIVRENRLIIETKTTVEVDNLVVKDLLDRLNVMLKRFAINLASVGMPFTWDLRDEKVRYGTDNLFGLLTYDYEYYEEDNRIEIGVSSLSRRTIKTTKAKITKPYELVVRQLDNYDITYGRIKVGFINRKALLTSVRKLERMKEDIKAQIEDNGDRPVEIPRELDNNMEVIYNMYEYFLVYDQLTDIVRLYRNNGYEEGNPLDKKHYMEITEYNIDKDLEEYGVSQSDLVKYYIYWKIRGLSRQKPVNILRYLTKIDYTLKQDTEEEIAENLARLEGIPSETASVISDELSEEEAKAELSEEEKSHDSSKVSMGNDKAKPINIEDVVVDEDEELNEEIGDYNDISEGALEEYEEFIDPNLLEEGTLEDVQREIGKERED